MNGTINELKQGLLKCANENWDRTYLTGQVIVSSICESAKKSIEELEEENQKLQEQVEKMKCCRNCEHFETTEDYGSCRAKCAKNKKGQWILTNWKLYKD
jgi:hypothetical protein